MDGKLDAGCLAQRLTGLQNEYWLHLDAKSALEKYPAKQHARRVQEKLGVEDGLIYLPGEPAKNNEDSDMPAPFRQRRYFYYLSGCNEPNCHLTYDIETDMLALFIPRIDPVRVIWNGRGSTPAEALDRYDIDQVFYVDQLQDYLQDWAKYYRGSLYILHPEQNPLIPGLHEYVDAESLQPAMNLARVVKDEHEIRLIRRANDISSRAHKEVLANILRFKNEAQVEGLFLNVCISKQAKQQAYDVIAASGPNAGTLHYDSNDQDFGDRQLMCLDAGCEFELYASDITRTFPLSGDWPSVEAKNIYQLVQRMQESCIQGLRPGVRYLDLHILAHQIAIDGLLNLGILHNGTREEIYKAGTSRAFFPHGLGHHVGLEVHDVGQKDLMSITKGNPKYEMAPSVFPKDYHLPVYNQSLCRSPVDTLSGHLEEGMVVTVEPGIYFSTYALNMFYLPSPVHSKYINIEVVERYLPVGGVRIEDDILITSKGYENLTTAPKGEAMLEIIRSQNAQWPFLSESADLGPTMRESATANEEPPLLRAPGFPRHTPEPVPKPLTRASTAPVERVRGGRTQDTMGFEPFNSPSLYTNFRRSRTTDENVRHWKDSRTRPTHNKGNTKSGTMCGESSLAVTHAYLDFPAEARFGPTSPRPQAEKKPVCKKCTILVEALDRLRDNLNKSEQNALKPKPVAEPATMVKGPKIEQPNQSSEPTSGFIPSSSLIKKEGLVTGEDKMLFTNKPPPFRTRAMPSFRHSVGVAAAQLTNGDNTVGHLASPQGTTTEILGPIYPSSRALVPRASMPILKRSIGKVDSKTLGKHACTHCEKWNLTCRTTPGHSACEECVLRVRAWDCDLVKMTPRPEASVAIGTTQAQLTWNGSQRPCTHCRRSELRCIWDASTSTCKACVASGRTCVIPDIFGPPQRTTSVTTDTNLPKYSSELMHPIFPANIDPLYNSSQTTNSHFPPEPIPAPTFKSVLASSPPLPSTSLSLPSLPIPPPNPCTLCVALSKPCNRTTRAGTCQTCTSDALLCPDSTPAIQLMQEAFHRCVTCHKRKKKCRGFSLYENCKRCERDGLVCEMPKVGGIDLNGMGIERRAEALLLAVDGWRLQSDEDREDEEDEENMERGGRGRGDGHDGR